MRKNRLAVLLLSSMIAVCGLRGVSAESVEEEEFSFDMDAFSDKMLSEEDVEGLILNEDPSEKSLGDSVVGEDLLDRSILELGSTDQVIIADNVYTVITEFGTTSMTPAFGWYCLTQDIEQQQLEYQQIMKDPVVFLQETMIPRGYHYLLFDSGFSVNIYQKQYSDEPSTAIGNANNLTAKQDAKYLECLIESSFEGYFSATLDAGGNHYFCFLSPDNSKAFYETIVNGVNYDFWVYASGEEGSTLTTEIVTSFEEMLEDFAIA